MPVGGIGARDDLGLKSGDLTVRVGIGGRVLANARIVRHEGRNQHHIEEGGAKAEPTNHRAAARAQECHHGSHDGRYHQHRQQH